METLQASLLQPKPVKCPIWRTRIAWNWFRLPSRTWKLVASWLPVLVVMVWFETILFLIFSKFLDTVHRYFVFYTNTWNHFKVPMKPSSCATSWPRLEPRLPWFTLLVPTLSARNPRDGCSTSVRFLEFGILTSNSSIYLNFSGFSLGCWPVQDPGDHLQYPGLHQRRSGRPDHQKSGCSPEHHWFVRRLGKCAKNPEF